MVSYNEEDLKSHHAVGVVLYDSFGRILIQDHVKYDFWTVPIEKAKPNQAPEDCAIEGVFDECNLRIRSIDEIACRPYSYARLGKEVSVMLHLFVAKNYDGILVNKESHKHRFLEYKFLDEIKNASRLSDATLLFLETLGFNRRDRFLL